MTRLLQLLLWAAVLAALGFALWPQVPASAGNPADKLQHFVAFFTLGLLGHLVYPRLSRRRLVVLLAGFGLLIELAQLVPGIHREASPFDLLADVVGAAAGVLAAAGLRAGLTPGGKRRRRLPDGTRPPLTGSVGKPTRGKR